MNSLTRYIVRTLSRRGLADRIPSIQKQSDGGCASPPIHERIDPRGPAQDLRLINQFFSEAVRLKASAHPAGEQIDLSLGAPAFGVAWEKAVIPENDAMAQLGAKGYRNRTRAFRVARCGCR